MSKFSDALERLKNLAGGEPDAFPTKLPDPDPVRVRAELRRVTEWALFGITGFSGHFANGVGVIEPVPDTALGAIELERRHWIRFVSVLRGCCGARRYDGAHEGSFPIPLTPEPNPITLVVTARFTPDAIDQRIDVALRFERPETLAWPRAAHAGGDTRIAHFFSHSHGTERIDVTFDGLRAVVRRTYSFGAFTDTLTLPEWEQLIAELRHVVGVDVEEPRDAIAHERRVAHEHGTADLVASIEIHPPAAQLRITIHTTWRDLE